MHLQVSLLQNLPDVGSFLLERFFLLVFVCCCFLQYLVKLVLRGCLAERVCYQGVFLRRELLLLERRSTSLQENRLGLVGWLENYPVFQGCLSASFSKPQGKTWCTGNSKSRSGLRQQ